MADQSHDDPNFEDQVVGWITVKMRRSGLMSIEGTITDRNATLGMLKTAHTTMKENFARQAKALEDGKPQIIVPAYDTAIAGTPYEKQLIKATDDLYTARDKV